MFSWSKNKKGSQSNHNDSSETKECASVPSAVRYPLHAAVLSKDAVALSRHLCHLAPVDPLLPDDTKPINELDHHGYTALHLCVFLAWEEGVDVLLQHSASPTVRSRSGWTALQESISTSQRTLLTKLLRHNLVEVRRNLALRSPIIRSSLRETDDFYVEVRWDFSSWLPLVSRLCPSDTFKIWKRGSDFRLDMSLVDFSLHGLRWKRGHLSLLFADTDFYVLDHDAQSFERADGGGGGSDSESLERESIEQLLQSELVSPEIITQRIDIERARSWMGYDKSASINGVDCAVFELKNLVVMATKRDSHVPKEVKQQRARTKLLFQQKMDAAKDTNSNSDTATATATMEETTPSSNSSSSTTSSSSRSSALKAIKGALGDIKAYDYVPYEAPHIDAAVYFGADSAAHMTRNAKGTATGKGKGKGKGKSVAAQLRAERTETFVLNSAESTVSSKAFKLKLAMADHFGLSIEEILAILEAAAPQSKLAAKLKQFLEIKMPRGFPVQLELPLFHVLKAKVTFQNFEHINPADDLFAIPKHYTEKKDTEDEHEHEHETTDDNNDDEE